MTTGKSRGVAIVEWEASPAGDVIADAVVALLMHAQSSSASIRLTSKPCRHPRSTEEEEPTKKLKREESTSESRLRLVHDTLKDQFEAVEAVYEGRTGTFEITTDSGLGPSALGEDGPLLCSATVSFEDELGVVAKITVECGDKKLANNVRECIQNLASAAAPIPT